MFDLDYNIRPCDNGYLVTKSWTEEDKNGSRSNYKANRFVFTTWDQVASWVSENAIDIPPVV